MNSNKIRTTGPAARRGLSPLLANIYLHPLDVLMIDSGYRMVRYADDFVILRRRLHAMLRKQEKRSGFGRCYADHQRWTNAFFAEAGLFAMHTAWLNARQSR